MRMNTVYDSMPVSSFVTERFLVLNISLSLFLKYFLFYQLCCLSVRELWPNLIFILQKPTYKRDIMLDARSAMMEVNKAGL